MTTQVCDPAPSARRLPG